MNSRTSRPRSPTRQMTFTSAFVERAIMPSSEDLPTPEPAKMPRRWPRPQGTRASRARTPSDTRSVMRGRSIGLGGAASIFDRGRSSTGGPPSMGRPSPSSTRPSSAGAVGNPDRLAGGGDPVAGPDAVHLAQRHQQGAPGPEADDLGRRRMAVATGGDVADLADLGLEAGRLDDQPDQVADAAVAHVQVAVRTADVWLPSRSVTRAAASAVLIVVLRLAVLARDALGDGLAGALQLGLQRGVDLALHGAHERPALGDAALGLHLAVLDAAELLDERGRGARG